MSSFLFHWSTWLVFRAVLCCFYCCSSVIQCEIWGGDASSSSFIIQVLGLFLAILVFFYVSVWSRSVFHEKLRWVFNSNCIKFADCFYAILILPTYEHGAPVHLLVSSFISSMFLLCTPFTSWIRIIPRFFLRLLWME